MEILRTYARDILAVPFNMDVRISGFYLLCTIALAMVIWLRRGQPDGFVRWLLPREVYRHRSNLLDIKLFLANRFLDVIGVMGAVFFPALVAYAGLTFLTGLTGTPYAPQPPTWGRALIATIVIVVASDFCKYWAHRWHHELRVLWPFHAVHHSADVLTPLTVMRAHPVEGAIRNLLITAIVGGVQAILLFALVGQLDPVTIGGANALYFLFNALGANFRHSHIWVSYGPVLEHIFISPAQHQIHHSVAVEHHDKNYGSMFALWDWMFGTLYIPEKQETLRFGISDKDGTVQPQPYETLRAAMFKPFRESMAALHSNNSTVAVASEPMVAAPGMTPGFSLWLDALRVLAAVTVLFGHMAHIRFTGGEYYVLREWNVASDAVIVFFVLSGVVIAYAAERDGSLERFSFNRMTRVVSVVAPALLLTFLFDRIGTGLDPSAYPEDFYQPLPASELFLRGLSFTNEWQGIWNRVRLGTNGPLWSLSYEVAFYAMFAVVVFLRGPLRPVLLLLLAVLVGLPILLLLPCWLLGVLVWREVSRGTVAVSRGRAVALAGLGLAGALVLKASGLPDLLSALTADAVAPNNHRILFGYSDEVLWNSILALFVALHLVGVAHLAQGWRVRRDQPVPRLVRWLAGASFSLYVMHYPTLHLLDAILPESLPGYHLILLTLTLTVCFGFAAIFERRLPQLRRALISLWAARPQRHAAD